MVAELPLIVDIAVPYRVSGSFHYTASQAIRDEISVGSLVEVCFKNRLTHGFVLGFPNSTSVERDKLKPVSAVLSRTPLFDENMLRLLLWVSQYYCHPIGEVLAAAIPKNTWKSSRKPKQLGSRFETEFTTISGGQTPELTGEQKMAVQTILNTDPSKPVLLHGVTGSGKTEVYMCILEKTLQEGRSGIILVPEIALTPQLLNCFSMRFPEKTAVLHSDLTPKERSNQWDRVRRGIAKIVIGARSAIFAPVSDLGLIVVDEEQEASFKQEDSLRYHARDIAIVRAQMEKARVILGSATPSIESYVNALSGKYQRVELKNRVFNRPMPHIQFVDLRERGNLYSQNIQWLSRNLVTKLDETLRLGGQSLLYLNRLGYAHFLFCEDCGYTYRCPDCDVALTYYANPPTLNCHYCRMIKIPPQICNQCSGHTIKPIGFGTEQIEKTIHQLFPKARIERMDRSRIKGRKDLEAILNRIAQREIDILIGTQMLAKGHDFPGISLVGILLADASLNIPDFRSLERTFQVVTQVSGRAGRAGECGSVILQTFNPTHPVLTAAAANKSEDFYQTEIDSRRKMAYPPFCRMAVIRFQHRRAEKVERFAQEWVSAVQEKAIDIGARILGPSEAPISKIKKLHRWQCVIKCGGVKKLQSLLQFGREFYALERRVVQMAIDVDPVSLV